MLVGLIATITGACMTKDDDVAYPRWLAAVGGFLSALLIWVCMGWILVCFCNRGPVYHPITDSDQVLLPLSV